MLDGTEYFECDCGAVEHTLRFVINKEDGEIYTEIYLNQHRSWYKRVWVAIKYVFGYTSRYGHWDCWTLHGKDVARLKRMCERL